MVVTEPKGDSADQSSTQYQWPSSSMSSMYAEDDSSSSSDPSRSMQEGNPRKRKGDEMDDEKELKRRKNREAAKRCRDKKQHQTEELKTKNGELEKENCQLAKQRDELIRKCKQYQREIEQHKQQGCVVPHFNPPYNLDHLLQPSSPLSPCISESAPSTSSCPSPAPSISPGPPARHPTPAHQDFPQALPVPQEGLSAGGVNQDMARSNSMTPVSTATPPGMTQVNQNSQQLHYLRVKIKDGSHKILCLDHESYLKVMVKLKAQRAAAAARNAQCQSLQVSPPTACLPAAYAQSQKMDLPQERPELQRSMNTDVIQSPVVSSEVQEQEASAKSGQKLDTCEDLISILKTHVKDTGHGFVLTPVNEDEVPIKQEPLDADYEQNMALTGDRPLGAGEMKQEDRVMPESSTGQQIRTSLDTLTNTDDLASNAHIQNIVKYLERDECNVQITASTTTRQQFGQPVMQNPQAAKPAQTATFITSSAPMGALHKGPVTSGSTPSLLQQMSRQASNQSTGQQHNRGQDTTGPQQHLVIPSMQTVKLRPQAANLMTSVSVAPGANPQTATNFSSASFSVAPGAKPQTATNFSSTSFSVAPGAKPQTATNFSSASSGLAGQNTGQREALRTQMVQVSRPDMPSSRSMAAETRLSPLPPCRTSTGSMQNPQGRSSMLMQPAPQLMPSQGLQPASTPALQRPVTSTVDTSAIGPLQIHETPRADNLMSESTSQIMEYLKTNGLETLTS